MAQNDTDTSTATTAAAATTKNATVAATTKKAGAEAIHACPLLSLFGLIAVLILMF